MSSKNDGVVRRWMGGDIEVAHWYYRNCDWSWYSHARLWAGDVFCLNDPDHAPVMVWPEALETDSLKGLI